MTKQHIIVSVSELPDGGFCSVNGVPITRKSVPQAILCPSDVDDLLSQFSVNELSGLALAGCTLNSNESRSLAHALKTLPQVLCVDIAPKIEPSLQGGMYFDIAALPVLSVQALDSYNAVKNIALCNPGRFPLRPESRKQAKRNESR
jgi:hypothetical protein